MIKRRSQVLCAWFLIWDLVFTVLAWLAAYFVRFESGLVPIQKVPPGFDLCIQNLPLVLLLSALAYRLTGQYAIHRMRRLREEAICVFKGTALLSLLVMATIFF